MLVDLLCRKAAEADTDSMWRILADQASDEFTVAGRRDLADEIRARTGRPAGGGGRAGFHAGEHAERDGDQRDDRGDGDGGGDSGSGPGGPG